MSAQFVEEQKTEPAADALDNDDSCGKEEPEARPRFARGTSSFYIAARDAYVSRASRLVVRRPKTILASLFAAVVVASAALVLSGFSISPSTQYEWDTQDDKYTIREAMISSANDRVDREDIRQQSDETYQFWFYYDTSQYDGKKTCDAPHGLFTARNVQEICEAERELLERNYADHCVLANNTCRPLEHSLTGFFYGTPGDCPLLAQEAVDGVAATLYADKARYEAYLDPGAYKARGYACRARSMFPMATPLQGFTDVGKYDFDDTQYKRSMRVLRRADSKLQSKYNMKPTFGQSALDKDARTGASGKKISVLWNSQLIQEEEFQAALNSDFSFVIFSFLFVWFWMWVHVGSFAVASFSMLQILISLPLSMFIYSVVFQIGYFGAMQILVVFIILGIGADDVFVYSDAWLQSAEDVEREFGEARGSYLERRVAYAYARALEAIFNTSFTTAVAFFATATSKIMPISTFGIFAAICVLMNYGLVMIATPAVWVLCTKRDPPTNDDEDALPESRTAGMESLEAGAGDDDADSEEKKRCCKAPACCGRLVDARRGLFGGYLRVVGKRPVALALVVATAAVGATLAYFASRLVPPSEPEEWFPPQHMYTRVQVLETNKFGASLANTFPDASLYWGLDHLRRPNFDRYEPHKHRGRVAFSAPIDLYTDDAQNQILFACDALRKARGGKLARPGSVVCFMEDFQAWHAQTYSTTTYGLDKATFDDRLSIFRTTTVPQNDVNPIPSWERIIGFSDGELRFVRVASRLNAKNDDSLDKKRRELKAMKKLRRDINDQPGTKELGDDLIDYSLTFSWYATQVALVDGLTFGLALAFPVAFVVLCFATSNLVLAFYAMVTIGLIVASVLGTVYLIGWNLGIKESVAGVVVIGFSVDYTIHLGHMFDVARSQGLTTRQEKFAYSIRKMGETVLAGAITTAGSTVFLLACQLTFFTAMGTLIILTVAYSLGYSLLFFMPLLRVAGPEGRVGDICHFLRGLKCACCRRA